MKYNPEKAIFAAGCFWGIEEAFYNAPGVISTRVGYTGGDFDNPTYDDVLGQKTGHAEAVEVTFDPRKTSYQELLELFWKIHDPTDYNRQGPNIGSNYRASIFYLDDNQKELALKSKQALETAREFTGKIKTTIEPAKKFWEAEDYHQKYFLKNPTRTC